MCLSGVHPLKSTLAASYNEFNITIEFGKHQHTVNLDIRVSFLKFVQNVVNSIAMCMCPHIERAPERAYAGALLDASACIH